MAKRSVRAAAAGAVMLSVYPVMANETGLAVLHSLRREGGQVCFLDHYHYGDSTGMPNERAARVSAIESWSGFVDLEYGSDWAKFPRAHSKSIKCVRSQAGWGCQIEARPCK